MPLLAGGAAVKQIFRRTIPLAAVPYTPPSILSPSFTFSSSSNNFTRERGVGLRPVCAHVSLLTLNTSPQPQNILLNPTNPPTTMIFPNNINNTTTTTTRKRLYNNNNKLSCGATNNNNTNTKNTFSIGERESDPSHSPPQSFNNNNNKMGVDGNDDNKQNGVVPSNEKEESSTKLLTLPTMLTLARVAAIPVFIATYYVNNWWGAAATTSIFVAAAITDWLDGYLARKMGLGTAFGAFLDPVADKLMVAATLVLLCSRPPATGVLGDAPWLFPLPAMAIIGREITMSAVREWAASQNAKLLQAVAVNNLGKWKTAAQMTALTILLATRDSSLAGPGPFATSGVALLYVSAGLAVWSLVVYMRNIWKVLLR